MGAKGDGKKSRPKQQPTPPPPALSPPPSQPPARNRVSDQSLLSVRKQIALVKAFEKRQAAGPAKPASKTKFRKKVKGEARRGRGNEDCENTGPVDVTLPLLFIDGYNVINAWPRLKKPFVKGDLLSSRMMLLDDVAAFTPGRYDSVVVFDANGAPDAMYGPDTLEDAFGGLFQVAYAKDSADAYIERETRKLRAEGRAVHVATNDNGIANACLLHNATVVSARWLVSELRSSRQATPAVVADFNKRQERLSGPAPTLWDAIDAPLREQLEAGIEQRKGASMTRKMREAAERRAAELEQGGQLESPRVRRMREQAEQRMRKRNAPPGRRE